MRSPDSDVSLSSGTCNVTAFQGGGSHCHLFTVCNICNIVECSEDSKRCQAPLINHHNQTIIFQAEKVLLSETLALAGGICLNTPW